MSPRIGRDTIIQRNPWDNQTAAQAAAIAANTSTIATAFRNETRLTTEQRRRRRPTANVESVVRRARCSVSMHSTVGSPCENLCLALIWIKDVGIYINCNKRVDFYYSLITHI